MEEHSLPSISDMYNCTRENHDYNVIKVYEGPHKNFGINAKPTTKDHYLKNIIKANCSPGPANSANIQPPWTKKNPFQSRRADKQTYLDEICKRQGKSGSPSPNHYSINMPWPKKRDQLKNINEKTNFADTCQYYSDKTPGPGAYNVVKHLGREQSDKKFEAHKPIKPKEVSCAEIATYHPVPLEYNTFDRYQLNKSQSHPILDNKPKTDKKTKENNMPGPATYSTISHWEGKSQTKKEKQLNFFKHLSKGPTPKIYN